MPWTGYGRGLSSRVGLFLATLAIILLPPVVGWPRSPAWLSLFPLGVCPFPRPFPLPLPLPLPFAAPRRVGVGCRVLCACPPPAWVPPPLGLPRPSGGLWVAPPRLAPFRPCSVRGGLLGRGPSLRLSSRRRCAGGQLRPWGLLPWGVGLGVGRGGVGVRARAACSRCRRSSRAPRLPPPCRGSRPLVCERSRSRSLGGTCPPLGRLGGSTPMDLRRPVSRRNGA